MTSTDENQKSPLWGNNIKIVVGLTLVAIVAGFLYKFKGIVAPLILAFVLTYLLHPVVDYLSGRTRLSWRMSVNIVFLVLIVALIASFTATGVAIVGQLQSLIDVVEKFVDTLPEMVMTWSSAKFQIGQIQIDMSDYLSTANLEALIQQTLSIVQPLLGQAGGVLRTLATGTASTLMWGGFVILISYFVLADTGQMTDQFLDIELPGYDADIRRMGREMSRIWNAFLRGQMILFVLTVLTYSILLTILGMRYAFGLALLAGLARFVPYVGPWVTWTVTALVAIFQRGNYFRLAMWQYALLVVVIIVIVDQIFDNMVSPRLLGRSLGVHPAGVLIAAIVAATLLGLVGVVLAAPVLATLTLLGRYITRKMLDLDPWPETEISAEPTKFPWVDWSKRAFDWARSVWPRKK
ncbi:MAG: AI-2E family transporter [Chloroflexota bacterium]|nr:AI-2E family transporter [Chloroflexota bacterium]